MPLGNSLVVAGQNNIWSPWQWKNVMFSFLFDRLLHQVENDSIFSKEGTSNTDIALPKLVSQRLSIWQCIVFFVTLTMFVKKLLVVDKASDGPSSDHPKGVSTIIG